MLQITDRRSGNRREVSLQCLIDMILPHIGTVSETPRSDEIQVLPIISSSRITLSLRPRAEGSLCVEIDTDGVPIYVGVSEMGMIVKMDVVFGRRKRSIQVRTSGVDVMIPLSDEKTSSACVDVTYDGNEIYMYVVLK